MFKNILKAVLLFVFALIATEAPQALAAEEKVLNIYAWSDYLSQESLDKFTEETGIKIVYTTYDSNEAMYAKLKLLKGEGYDLVIPSTYFIDQMRNEKMLTKIDKSKLPNFKNLKPELLKQSFDPANDYSVPYLWGSAGLIVNKKFIDPASVTSWSDLWRPEYKDRVLMPDDVRDAFGIALLSLGKSSNSRDEAEIKAAYELLNKLRPSVRVFSSNSGTQPMASEETYIGAIWNGEAYLAMEENEDLEFIYPKEGGIIWIDSFVIPAAAKHPNNAHKFIDFMLRPENGVLAVEEFKYSTANTQAQKMLPKELQESHVISPTAEELKGSETSLSVGDAAAIYEKYWEMFRTGSK